MSIPFSPHLCISARVHHSSIRGASFGSSGLRVAECEGSTSSLKSRGGFRTARAIRALVLYAIGQTTMRLINTITMELQESRVATQPYAILSHRWQAGLHGEATLQDLRAHLSTMQHGIPADCETRPQDEVKSTPSKATSKEQKIVKWKRLLTEKRSRASHTRPRALDKTECDPRQERSLSNGQVSASTGAPCARLEESPGLRKAFEFCSVARAHGYEWAWIDTVCIDKTNMTELDEAINSMFEWYRSSVSCFVYLQDIDSELSKYDLGSSSWFTRGWTLQELVAPRNIDFFDKNWKYLGTKVSLRNELSVASGIPLDVIDDPDTLHRYNNAQRLSWAANRVTAREEDRTYCLLGLLDIHITLTYGEGGTRAFERMQQHLIESFDDESQLAWDVTNVHTDLIGAEMVSVRLPDSTECIRGAKTGLWAHDPVQFARCTDIHPDPARAPPSPNRITNRGLEVMRRTITPFCEANTAKGNGEGCSGMDAADLRIIPLACSYKSTNEPCLITVILDNHARDAAANRWSRLLFSGAEAQRFDTYLKHAQLKTQDERLFLRLHPPLKNLARGRYGSARHIRDVRELNVIEVDDRT